MFLSTLAGRNSVFCFEGSEKACVITETAFFIDGSGTLPVFDHALCHQKALIRDVFFRCLAELCLEEAVKIAFTDEKLFCDLFHITKSAEILVDIAQCLFEQVRGGRHFLGGGCTGEAEIIKKLTEKVCE